MPRRARTMNESLPGRAPNAGVIGRETAVKHYAERINARADLTDREKAAAIKHYADGMGVTVQE